MPDMTERDIRCPHCGAIIRFRFYEHVNVQRHPEWKELVTDGNIFDLHCEKCGHDSRIGYPMIYHDPDKHFMVMMADANNTRDAYSSLKALISDPDEGAAFGPDYRFRAVTQPASMSEKILIFDAGLDDRIVELLKMMSVLSWSAANGDRKPERIYLNDPDRLEFVVFPGSGVAPMMCHFTHEDYQTCVDNYAAFFPAPLEKNLFVDEAWTDKLLKPASRLQ